jgi:hypothetical protein
MAKRPKLTGEHYHEFIDRLHVITSNIDTHIIQHPVCKLDKELCTKVEKALDILYEAYQLGGSKMFEINAQYVNTQTLGLLNYEGDVLSIKKLGKNQFMFLDQWKKNLGVYSALFVQDFIKGKVNVIDSHNKAWNFAEAHENARTSLETIINYIENEKV